MSSDAAHHGDRFDLDAQDRALLAAAGLDSLTALLAVQDGADLLSKPSLAPWRQRLRLSAGGQTYFLKRYRRPPLLEQLRQRLRSFPATAAVEWHWLRQLRELGINAPRPAAMGYRRRGWLETHSILLVAQVPGQSLEKWLSNPDHLPRLEHRPFKQQLACALADLVRTLHRAGLFHRDLYLAHLFLEEPSPGQVRLWLIDLQRMIQPPLRRRRWIVKDLASLNYSTPARAASTADRLRWFKRYRGIDRLRAEDRRLIRAIVAKTRRIARHSAKRGLG